MAVSIHHYLNELKKQLALKSDIREVSPSDCKFLSVEIYKVTKRRISETTLKRIFGFAISRFSPSSFTLNSISEYCGFNGWKDFCSSFHPCDNSENKPETLTKIAENAKRITTYTLQILKAKSGIPYEKTIPRKFLSKHMEIFLNGDYTATLLSAPADFGKTTALCHWIDDLIERNTKTGKKDIILFFNNNVLLNPAISANNLNDWLLALLGIHGDGDLSDLSGLREGINNFYLIIDALDSDPTKVDYTLFNQIIDIISLYKDHKWLKIIISVRCPVSANNWHHITDKDQKWFPGFMTSNTGYINVPLLEYNEILDIAHNLRPDEQEHFLEPEMLSDLSYPTCLQYHFQNNPAHFSLKMSSEFSVFESVSSYFLNRIYRNRYKDDIGVLLLSLVTEMDIINGNYNVNSFKVHKLLKNYHKAYLELLNLGFLQELNISNGFNFVNNISIVPRHGLNRTLARKILIECNYIFDENLINKLNSEFNISIRSDLLKWCIYLVISSGHNCDFMLLKKAEIKVSETTEIGIFLMDLLKKYPAALNQTRDESLNDNKNIEYFFGLEYLGKKYDRILNSIISFNLSEKYAIISRTYIAFMAVIQLDMKKLETQIAELKSFSAEHFLEFFINPLNCLEAIYYYLRFGIIQKDPLAQLTGFYFNPVMHTNQSYPVVFNEILHLIGLYTLSICNNEKKTMRFIIALKKIYPSGSLCYNFLFRTLKGEIYMNLGKKNDAIRILRHLSPYYEEENSSLTGFMKISYQALKTKLENLNSAPDIDQINALTRFCDEEHCCLIKVQFLAFLLKNNLRLKGNSQIFDQFYFNFERTTFEHGCKVNSF